MSRKRGKIRAYRAKTRKNPKWNVLSDKAHGSGMDCVRRPRNPFSVAAGDAAKNQEATLQPAATKRHLLH
jgi:hypothetical protein